MDVRTKVIALSAQFKSQQTTAEQVWMNNLMTSYVDNLRGLIQYHQLDSVEFNNTPHTYKASKVTKEEKILINFSCSYNKKEYAVHMFCCMGNNFERFNL
jgi:hypothetical protein